MYYLYDGKKRLTPLSLDPQNALRIAQLHDAILVSNRIEEMVRIAPYPKSGFLLTAHNRYSLFRYCVYQAKARTLSEFRLILYTLPTKSWLYYLLKATASLSFGYYQLMQFSKGQSQ
ncbi:MAG: hypothetical protein WA080_06705 [Sulfuricurvum sp.]